MLRIGALIAVLSTSCMHHRGAGWEAPAPGRKDPITLVLLGDAGRAGSTAAHTAARLEQVLASETKAGHYPKVLWLGDNILQGCPERPWAREGSRQMAATVRAHMKSGGGSFAVAGDEDRGCKGILDEDRSAGHPWDMPAPSYVVRVDQVGGARVVSSCGDHTCALEEATELALVDLVFLDTAAYGRTPDATVPGADRIVAALRATPGPPRILVTHVPVESAGIHGLGGAEPDAAWRYQPPELRSALQDGVFVGVLSAHDRNLQVIPDLSPALMRSEKVATPHPVFQVVSGAASDPDAAAPARRIDRRRGFTATPVLSSDHPGFAVLRVTSQTVDVTLHARRGRTWRTGTTSFPLRPAALPPARAQVSQTPCRDCPAVPAPARP